MILAAKKALAAEQTVKARLAAFRAKHRISLPLWGKVVATIAKQRFWPRARHGFAMRNLEEGTRDIELHWLPERRMWAIWLRVGNEVYADTKPRLRHFVVGVDDILTRAESGDPSGSVGPFG